ncbi:MAG: helix-turn-helix domain-containing protein [Neglectibacter sp.]
MTVGEKIKKIRTFRGMTQKELGSMLRMGSRGADNRIAQYETNYRVPKAELLDGIAGALNVNPQNFYDPVPDSLDAFIYRLLWLEEDFPGYIHLFQLERCPGDRETESEPVARYEDGKNWPVYPPVGMYFDGELVGDFCGNGFCASGSWHTARSPTTNTLPGRSTGLILLTARRFHPLRGLAQIK